MFWNFFVTWTFFGALLSFRLYYYGGAGVNIFLEIKLVPPGPRSRSLFLTTILHRGHKNCVFFCSFNFQILFVFLFPLCIWTFISLFYLDFSFAIFLLLCNKGFKKQTKLCYIFWSTFIKTLLKVFQKLVDLMAARRHNSI